ncbi:MAG: LCP family protein [Clostridiales bacterium]|nr:LCP family protein [Clostridiales bacterium]
MANDELIFPGNGGKKRQPARKPENMPSAEVKQIREEKLPTEKKIVEDKFSFAEQEETKPFNTGKLQERNEGLDDYIAKKRDKRRRRNRILLRVGMGILGLLLGVVIFGLWYKHYMFSKVTFIEPTPTASFVNDEGEVIEISKLREELKPQIPVIEDESIHNFLLIGIDSRSKSYSKDGKGGLADVIMIMSVDNKAGTIKLMSIARDSYVYVPGYKNPMKINAAMSQGGPDLLQLTVENTLRLEIDGYAFVNFYNMSKVIDAAGGVFVNVSNSELYSAAGLNDNLREINTISGYDADYQLVNNTGDVWLNGRQAVAYARIRHVDSDYKRSERQVEVLRSLMSRFMDMSIVDKGACLDNILELIATNIPEDEITKYALEFLPSLKGASIQYFQLPLEGFYNSGMYGDEWSIRNNWNETIPYVQEFLYGERKDFDPVDNIPNQKENCPDDFDVQEHIQG